MGDSNTVLHKKQNIFMLVGILNVLTKWGYDHRGLYDHITSRHSLSTTERTFKMGTKDGIILVFLVWSLFLNFSKYRPVIPENYGCASFVGCRGDEDCRVH